MQLCSQVQLPNEWTAYFSSMSIEQPKSWSDHCNQEKWLLHLFLSSIMDGDLPTSAMAAQQRWLFQVLLMRDAAVHKQCCMLKSWLAIRGISGL